MSDDTTWRKEIEIVMRHHGETWSDIESCTLSDSQLDQIFDSGFGYPEGQPFTVWTKNRVYFPVVYDGAESVASVSRHPDGVPTSHVGDQ